MAEDADIPTPEQKLRAEVEMMLKKKMKRGDDVSEVQRCLDLDASFLWLTIEIDQPTMARVRFHFGEYDAWPASSGPVDVEIRDLQQLIANFHQPVMDRVFVVDLKLSPSPGLSDLALLTTIHAKIQKHKFELHLAATNTPIELLTDNPGGKLSELQRVKLRSLTLDCVNPDKLNPPDDRMLDYINYFNTSEMQRPIDKLEVRLRDCGHQLNEIGRVIQRFPRVTSLHMIYANQPIIESQPLKMPSAGEWATLSDLPQLKHLEVVAHRRFGPRISGNALPLVNLETLAFENIRIDRGFFTQVPNLATLRIQHRVVDKTGPERFDFRNIDEVVNAIRNGQLRELETLHIRATRFNLMPINGMMRSICEAIVDNYSSACTKLQTLVHDYRCYVNGIDNSVVDLLQDGPFQFLAKIPLTIEVPQAFSILFNAYGGQEALDEFWILRSLCLAVYHSGLHCLKLTWRFHISRPNRQQLVAALNRIQTELSVKEARIQKVTIVEPTHDSIVLDSDGNVETIRSIVWQNVQPEGSFEQRIELTHRGLLHPLQAATGQARGIVVKQPDTAAAGENGQGEPQPSTSKSCSK